MTPLERAITQLRSLPVPARDQAIDFIEFLNAKTLQTPTLKSRFWETKSFQPDTSLDHARSPVHNNGNGDRHHSLHNGNGHGVQGSESADLDLRRSVYQLVERSLPRLGSPAAKAADLYKVYARSNPSLLLDRHSFHEILVELASPLVGYLGRETGSDWEHERFWVDRGWPEHKNGA